MKFTKMHGLGNDYIYVNCFSEQVVDPAAVARAVSDRHFGIGGDGLILILPSDKADARMRMFNSDGSEGEMCGNAVRCVAKYVYDRGISRNNPMKIETGRGVLDLDLKVREGKVELVTVMMREPILDLPQVGVNPESVNKTDHPHEYRLGLAANYTRDPAARGNPRGLGQRPTLVNAVFVSMGNPHAVVFTEDLAEVDLERFGPLMEHHIAFPRRINAHWAQVNSKTDVSMRTWERGSGITLACGTGACAVLVAGALTGRLDRKALVHLPGGDLTIEWRQSDNNVYMTGPATEVFSGEWVK